MGRVFIHLHCFKLHVRDVRGGVRYAFRVELYVPHLLNCVSVDGIGLAMDKKWCKNPLARQLVDDTRRIVEHFNKSDATKVESLAMNGQGVEGSCGTRDNTVTCRKSREHEPLSSPLSSCSACSAA